jgi:predicted helicase
MPAASAGSASATDRSSRSSSDLLEARARDASICPSEAARRLADGGDWRVEMESVRMAARRLRRAGVIDITQAGRAVDPDTAKGPIRLRLRPVGMQV